MMRTSFAKALVATVVAGALGIGVATTAFASPAPSPGSTPAPAVGSAAPTAHKHCARADVRIDHLQKREQTLENRLEALKARDAKARAAHRDDVAERIEKRIDRVQKLHDRIADRVAKIRTRCSVPAAQTPTPPVPGL